MDKLNLFEERQKACETIDICTTLIARFDEQSILPIIFTLEDTVISYYLAKYKEEGITREFIEDMRHNTHKNYGYYGYYEEMDEDTMKMYDNSKIKINTKEVKHID